MKLHSLQEIVLSIVVLSACSCSSAPELRFAPDLPGQQEMMTQTLGEYYARPEYALSPPPPEMADRLKVEVQLPIAQYKLSAENVVAGKGLEVAKLDSYRYYVKASGNYIAIIDAACGNGTFQVKGKNGKLITMSGYFVDGGRARLKSGLDPVFAQIEALTQLRHGSYEFRFLDLPALGRNIYRPPMVPYEQPGYTEPDTVVWLKSDKPDKDWIYTFPEDSIIEKWTSLKPGKLYSVPELLNGIRPAIKAFQENEAKAGRTR